MVFFDFLTLCIRLPLDSGPEPLKVYDPKMAENDTFWHFLAIFGSLWPFRPKNNLKLRVKSAILATVKGRSAQNISGGAHVLIRCFKNFETTTPGSKTLVKDQTLLITNLQEKKIKI